MSFRKSEQPSNEIVPVAKDHLRPAIVEPVIGEYYGRVQTRSAIARGYLQMLRRQRWTLLLTFLLVMGAGMAWTLTRPPAYRSTAEVLVTPIERSSGNGPNIADTIGVMTRARSVATEVKMLKSPDLLEEAFASLPSILRVRGFKTAQTKMDNYPVSVNATKDTDVVSVEVTAGDPEAAARFANAIIEKNLKRNEETTRGIAMTTTKNVDAELNDCEKKLRQTWAKLTAFKRAHGVVDIPTQIAAEAQGLANLESQSTQARVEMVRARLTRQSLEKELRKTPAIIETARTAADNPVIHTINGEIERLQQQRASLLQDYQPTAPEIRAVDDQIAAATARKEAVINSKTVTVTTNRNPLMDNLTQNYINALVAEQESSSRLAITRSGAGRVRGRISSLPASEEAVALLSSRINELQSTHAYLAAQKEALNLSMRGGLPSVVAITNAAPSRWPVSPNVPASVLLMLVLSTIIAVGLAVLRDQWDGKIHDVDVLENLSGHRVLASLPIVRNGWRGLVTEPSGPAALLESFRVLRGNILLSMPEPLPRVIMITSPQPGDGKSTTAANLAATIAMSGRRVLLIDCDLRHPSLHIIYEQGNEVGLSSVLAGEVNAADALCATNYENLQLLPAGPTNGSAPELLSSPRMSMLLNELREEYDTILLDSTPMMNLSDGQLTAALAEGVLVVISSDRTRHPDLLGTLRILEQMRAPIIGLVYNRSDDTPEIKWDYANAA